MFSIKWLRATNYTSVNILKFIAENIRVVLITIVMSISSGFLVTLLGLTIHVFLVLIIAGTGTYVLVVNVHRSKDLFDPINLFIPFYLLYSLVLPIRILIYDKVDVYNSFALTTYLITIFVGLIGFFIGYFCLFNKSNLIQLPHLPYIRDRDVSVLRWILLIIGIVLIVILINTEGGLDAYINVPYGGQVFLTLENKGQLTYGFTLILVSITLTNVLSVRNRFEKFVSIFLITIYTLYDLQLGHRGDLLFLFLSTTVVYHYLVKPIPIKLGLIACFFGFWAFIIFNHIRAEPGIMPKIASLQNITPEWFNILITSGEFQAPALALWTFTQSRIMDFRLGMTYIEGILSFIPSFIYPGRPDTPVTWFLKTYYPTLVETGNGLGFLTVAEGYMNFGIVGSFIQLSVMGIFWRSSYRYLVKYKRNVISVAIYALTLSTIFTSLRIDTETWFKSLIYYVSPILVFLLISRKFRYHVKSIDNATEDGKI